MYLICVGKIFYYVLKINYAYNIRCYTIYKSNFAYNTDIL